jgi:hypothetical protein
MFGFLRSLFRRAPSPEAVCRIEGHKPEDISGTLAQLVLRMGLPVRCIRCGILLVAKLDE